MTRGKRRDFETVQGAHGAVPAARPDRAHPFEEDRIRSLRAYQVLDTADEPAFDVLVRSTASLLGTTSAALNLVDSRSQYSKALFGPGLREMPRGWSICSDVVADERPIVITDIAQDPRYRTNPLAFAPGSFRSYAGVPLMGRDGLPLGALAVTHNEPREFTEADLDLLASLAESAVALLEVRRHDLDIGRPHRLKGPEAGQENYSAAGVRRALNHQEFEVHFQPIVALPDGQLVGVEALVRWNVPGVGLVPPSHFLSYVEGSALLSRAFTEFVLNSACAELVHWRAMGAANLRVSVNVSGYDVTGGALPAMVAAALRDSGLPASALTLEITETVNLRDRVAAISSLSRIRELGVKVTLDDFGVGYSSLEHAGLLPVSGLKLDRDLVSGASGSRAMTATLNSVVALCASLTLDLVGEGVETLEVADLLITSGVRLAQGYYFSRPVPAERISEIIARGTGGQLPFLPLPDLIAAVSISA